MPANITKKIEKRFYILISVVILSLILGLFVLFKKSPVKSKGKRWAKDAFSLFRESKLPLLKKGIVILNIDGVIQFGAKRGVFGIEYTIFRKSRSYRNDTDARSHDG